MIVFLIIYAVSIAVIIYTLFIFPLILLIRGTFFFVPHQVNKNTFPTITMIVAVYNEASSIEMKLQNIKSLDYPVSKLQVIIASDGSSDDTNIIAERYTDEQIQLLTLPRVGKAEALNRAAKYAHGDILVFSDANSQYLPDALSQLVQHFADERIGGVAGNQLYVSETDDPGSMGEIKYWSFDRQLKIWESNGGNTISATGAIYAIRRTLFQGVVEGVTDDFYVSTNVIAQGYRLIFEPNAVAFEHVAKDQQKEFERKVRIMTRGLTGVLVMRHLLNPVRYGFYSIQLFTHKVLRRLLFVPFVLLFVANMFLTLDGIVYLLTLLPQFVVYGLVVIGWVLSRQNRSLPRIIALPTYAMMVYVAAAYATWNVMTGNRIIQWSTHRTNSRKDT